MLSILRKEYKKIVSHRIGNKDELQKSQLCGCTYCFKIFPAKKVESYIIENDKKETGQCPYCERDAIIGDASGYKLTDELIPAFEELKKIHNHSFKNKEELQKSKKCACFHCFKVFPVEEIEMYLPEKDGIETALCPYCVCDTIIGDASGYELTDDLIDVLAYELLRGLTRNMMKDFGGPEIVVLD